MTVVKLNRRQFLAALPLVGDGASAVGQPGSSPAAGSAWASAWREDAGAAGNTCPVLGYKRLILDYHFSEFNPLTLKKANAREIVDAMVSLGIDSLLLYSKDHWGNVYHQSAFSKRHRNVPQDLFGEVLAGLKKRGIRVIAYTTVCWDEDSARRHSDWVMRDAEGKALRAYEGPNLYAKWTWLCLDTPYRDYFLRQVDELIGNYDFEALFLDIVFYRPGVICYEPYCQKRWRDQYGEEIPKTMTPRDLARFLDFQRKDFESFFEQVREVGHRRHKQFMLTHNFGLTYRYDDYVAMEFDTHGADFYQPSLRAKLYRARARGKEVEVIGHRFNQRWDFTTKPVPLLQYQTATAVAHNAAIMFVDQPYLDGSLDPQVYEALKKGFVAADDLVPIAKGTVPYAELGLLSSERSFKLDVSCYRDFCGAFEMLTQLHWPFDVLTAEGLNATELGKYRTLIVPNIVHLSAVQADAVRRYVAKGGNLFFCS